MRRPARWLLLLAAVALTGCAGTFSAVTPQGTGARPVVHPRALVVGEIRAPEPAWEAYRPHFVSGLREWVKKNGAFDQVVTDLAGAPPEAVVLTGTFTEIDKGSAAMRLLVGMGAGQAKAKGDFELRSPDGAVLASFTARRSYLGGMGIGGAGLLDMDELVSRLGETVAETTVRWLRGEKID